MLHFEKTKHANPAWDIFDIAGFIPDFLDESDERSAKEQIHSSYAHGGGWNSFSGFELKDDNFIKYPGDPALPPLAYAKLRDETIYIYPHAWVLILQPNGSFEIARID